MMWTSKAVCGSLLRKMQKIEKKKKSFQEKALKARNKIVTAIRKKVANQFTSK